MRTIKNVLVIVCIIFSYNIFAQSEADKKLELVDNILNAPADQEITVKITIYDKKGNESVRELVLMQKGCCKRMTKFISPADQKGIAFLSLPNDNMSMYMPAYGKTRKVAGHVKNTKFAGTDYTYEDMEAKKYTEKYTPKLIKTEADKYLLELTPKDIAKSEYSKLHMTVRSSDNYPVLTEYYDKGGKLVKKMTSSNIKKVGKYLLSHETTLEDLRTKTKTKMEISNVKFDTKLSDDFFTERYLTR